ncbi:MAG: hypothetical protein ACYDG2_06480 [Ruminiclostridium sp.]
MDNYKYIESIYLKSFINLGYNIYHFVMPYHFERNSNNSLNNGELMVTSNIDRTLLSIKQAVSDLRALIKWLKANSLAHSVWNTIPGKYIKKDLIANSVLYNQLKDYWAAITPSLYQPFPKVNH